VEAKTRFDHIYDRPDPRAYFEVLGDLGYREAANCQAVVDGLRSALPTRGRRPVVLDLCCSYGIVGALLRFDVTLADLDARYRGESARSRSAEQLADADRAWLAGRQRPDAPVVLGVDSADAAVRYGVRIGALDEGWAVNLEAGDPPAELADAMGRVDLVTVAGGVGYVTERTFARLLAAAPDPPPWVAALVVRMYPYDGIAATLADHGLVTERLSGVTFPRRRFAGDEERDGVLARLAARGIDPAGRESDGWYHAELYLSRPAADADPPVDKLLADVRPVPVGPY
jgi:hypothetical protein